MREREREEETERGLMLGRWLHHAVEPQVKVMTLELERVALEKVPLIEMSSRGGGGSHKRG